MVKNILFGLLVIVALVSCNNDDDDPPVPKKYNLKILVTPGDGGTVSRSIYGPIIEGNTMQLQADPSDNFRFKEWQGDVTGTNSSISIQMNTDKTITAAFDSYDPKELFYLDTNGVTVKCQDWGAPGQSGELNGIVYTIVDRDRLKEMIVRKEDVSTVCTSKITDMSNVCSSPGFNQDISSWDVSNVTDMYAMFSQAFGFDQDISSWDVSNVTNMRVMFYECGLFNKEIGSWDVRNVSDMGSMFRGAHRFNQDISSWDVSSVTDMSYMFIDSQFNQDINSWNVSNVTDMGYMFRNALFNQDISSWNVSTVTNMESMFESSKFNQDLSAWTVDNVTDCSGFSDDTPQWILPKPDFTNCDP